MCLSIDRAAGSVYFKRANATIFCERDVVEVNNLLLFRLINCRFKESVESKITSYKSVQLLY